MLKLSMETRNWTLWLCRGADIWREMGVVRGAEGWGRENHTFPGFLCPVELAVCHLTERSALSSPGQPFDLGGCRDIICCARLKTRAHYRIKAWSLCFTVRTRFSMTRKARHKALFRQSYHRSLGVSAHFHVCLQAKSYDVDDRDVFMSSYENRFRLFSSLEHDGQLYMTPLNFIESVTLNEPRSEYHSAGPHVKSSSVLISLSMRTIKDLH